MIFSKKNLNEWAMPPAMRYTIKQRPVKTLEQILFWCFSFVYLLYVLFFLYQADIKGLLLLIPSVFFYFFVVIYGRIFQNLAFIGCSIFFIVSLLRYFLIPFTQMADKLMLNSLFFNNGISLYIMEAFVICLFFGMLLRYCYPKIQKLSQNSSSFNISWRDIALGPVYTVLLLAAAVTILTNTSVLQDYHFILQLEESDMFHAEYQGVGMVFVELGKTILTAMLTVFFAYLYAKTKSKIFYFLAIGTVLILCMGILFGYSRHSILVPSVAGVYLLVYLFPREKFFTIGVLCASLFFAVLLVTMLKNNRYEVGLDSYYYDMYFSGPHNLGGAVIAAKQFSNNISEKTFTNDLFYNVPGFGHFFESYDRTTTYFNNAMGTHMNIISTIGQAKMLFGNFFCMIPELFYLLLLSQFDQLVLKLKRVYYVFPMMLITCRIGFFFYQNISNITGFLLGNALFYVILMLLDHQYLYYFGKTKENSL